MKKNLWILLGCFLVAAVMCLSVSWPKNSAQGPLLPTKPPGPGPTTGAAEPDVVRLYVCSREDMTLYNALAQKYAEQTGNVCELLVGDLATLMESETPPTVFCVHSEAEATRWQRYCLDLTGSVALEQLYQENFALTADGAPIALAMDLEGYGLIYNAALLAQAGYTRSDIVDFASLQTVAEYISAEQSILGFRPFGKADLDDTTLVGYLAGLGKDPDDIRHFFDLYTANSTTSGNPLMLFMQGQTVFYVGGVWEYDQIESMGIHNLDILPVYTPSGGSFHCVVNTYWAVNGTLVSEEAETGLEFLAWLVTAGEDGTLPVDTLTMLSPFAGATASENAFDRLFRKYISTENVDVRWRLSGQTPQHMLMDVADALSVYMQDPSIENWDAVARLLSS